MEKLFKEAATQFMENMLHAVVEEEKEDVDMDADEAISEQATELMLKLQRTRTDRTKTKAVAELLAFAKKNPSWIDKLFLFKKTDRRTILHGFAEKKADLASIQTLCGLVPDVPKLVATKSQKGEYPLYSAIRSGAPPDVLEFLIDQEPGILSMPSKRKLPIELAEDHASNHRKYDGLRMILAELPSSSEELQIEIAFLKRAFFNSFPVDILKHMVTLPTKEPIKEWNIHRLMTFEEIKVFCTLLPRIKSLTCTLQSSWESHDAFLHFMGELQKTPTLFKLRLLMLPSLHNLAPAKQKDVTAALTDLLCQDKSQLDTVSLNFVEHDTDKSEKVWFDAIFPALSNGKSSIRHFSIYPPFRPVRPVWFDETKETCLEMLQSINTSLISCEPWEYHDNEIRHLLDLNRYGRGKAREDTCTSRKMVELLLDLMMGEDISLLEKNSLSYLLLKENPGVWSEPKVRTPPVEVDNETEPEYETGHDKAFKEGPQQQKQSSKGKRKPTSVQGKRNGKHQKRGSS